MSTCVQSGRTAVPGMPGCCPAQLQTVWFVTGLTSALQHVVMDSMGAWQNHTRPVGSSMVHEGEQPSPAATFPSSHSSLGSCDSLAPFPHTEGADEDEDDDELDDELCDDDELDEDEKEDDEELDDDELEDELELELEEEELEDELDEELCDELELESGMA